MPTSTSLVDSLLELRDPLELGRNLPAVLRKVLPEPLASFDDWKRFVHEDLDELSPAERRWEALRLKAAAARLEYEHVPPWVFQRLGRLKAAG